MACIEHWHEDGRMSVDFLGSYELVEANCFASKQKRN